MAGDGKIRAIERILSSDAGERWFRDGHRSWREGRDDERRPMSAREAQAQRRRDVKMLRRHCKGNPRGLRLADLIESCGPRHRCLSGACIECNRATQRVFVEASEALLRRSSVRVSAISIVLKNARVLVGSLSDPSDLFEPLSRHLQSALRLAGVRQAFGGFDVSANEHDRSRFSPHYRPHAYVFVPTRQFKRAEQKFRAFFATSDAVRRPVVARDFDGNPKALAYALKRNFQRRVTLPRQRLSNGAIKRRNTRDRPLRARQKVELGLALNQLGLGARIFLHGLRMVEAHGELRIVRSALEPPYRGGRTRRIPRGAAARLIKPAARPNTVGTPSPSNAKRMRRTEIRSADNPRRR